MRHVLDTRDNPYGNAPEPSKLEDKVLGLLEDAEIDTAICDQICKLVEQGERKRFEVDNKAVKKALPERRDANGDIIPWAKEHDYFMAFDPENPDVPTD